MKKKAMKPSPKKQSPKLAMAVSENQRIEVRRISNGFLTSSYNPKTGKSSEKFYPNNPLQGKS